MQAQTAEYLNLGRRYRMLPEEKSREKELMFPIDQSIIQSQ